MNRTILKPNELRKRFIIIVVLLLAALAAAGTLIGCGDDINGNNGNGNPPANSDSLILSLDSFNITGTGTLTNDTLFNLFNSTFDSLKITFNVRSNCDTLDNAVLNVTFGNSGLLFFHRDLNSSYTLFASKNDSFWFALYSQFNTSQQRYIKAENFKLYLR